MNQNNTPMWQMPLIFLFRISRLFQENSWGLDSGRGCTPCECDSLGSVYSQCDQRTGQCTCRPGVEGQKCDQCAPGYYGFSINGCKRKQSKTSHHILNVVYVQH